ncbi:MAG: transposase [Patescibacteria group bacterium]|jgi:putative transposase
MPAKNSIKTYIENGFYHVYNRGVEKRNIFLDQQDYCVFLSYLKIYLSPIEKSINDINKDNSADFKNKNKIISEIYTLNNFFNKIELVCYVLMPNHFHFELRQTNRKDIEIFMRSLITKYTMYFNRKYHRVGPLFQGRYKAVLIQNEEYFLHLSRYIHLNPREILNREQPLETYPWSSYQTYLNIIKINWIKKDIILNIFVKNTFHKFESYKIFIENYKEKSEEEYKTHVSLLLD